MQRKQRKVKPLKSAFTLAEVLITLAIIGIIAVLTLPSLSNVYQKRVMTSQLQRAFAELSQAGAILVANEFVDDFHKAKTLKQGKFVGKYLLLSDRNEFADYYGFVDNPDAHYDLWKKGGAAGVDRCDSVKPGTTCIDCGVTKSGASVCVGNWGAGILDINGKKGPNIMGRDAFAIGFAKDGSLDPDYSRALKTIIDADWDIEAYR